MREEKTIKFLFKNGKYFENEWCWGKSKKMKEGKLIISVGKKCGSAVIRNRFKRIIRFLMRKYCEENKFFIFICAKTSIKNEKLEMKNFYVSFSNIFRGIEC